MAEQKQSARTLPKNIRQIGMSKGSCRVYLEDYVYTYLHAQEEQEDWLHRGFVLLGKVESGRDYTRYFISGLIRVEDTFFKDGVLEFGDDTWAYIYKEMKKYYDDLEITGWGQDVSGASASLTAELERSHKQNFNIQKNVLFLLDHVENEEAFYVFEKNVLQRKEGYYVYYEKNPQMQEYMIESQKSRQLDIPPEEIEEPLVHSYRETLLEKKAQLSARKWNGVLYATSMMLVLSVCVLGVSTVNNVEKMQNLESAVSKISGQDGQAGGVPAMSQNTGKPDETEISSKADSGSQGDKSGAKGAKTGSDSGSGQEDSKGTETDSTGENSGSDSGSSTGEGNEFDADGSGENSGNASKSGSTGESSGNASKSGSTGENSGSGTDSRDGSKSAKGSGKEESGSDPQADMRESEQISSDSLETAAISEAQTYLLQGYYIVKKGDSLAGISRKIYGTASKAKKICELNGIDDMDKIYAGQRLDLP